MDEETNLKLPTLRSLRESLGKSQKDLALILGVKQQAISLWESGERMPTLDNAVKLAGALGVSLRTLAMAMRIDVSKLPEDINSN